VRLLAGWPSAAISTDVAAIQAAINPGASPPPPLPVLARYTLDAVPPLNPCAAGAQQSCTTCCPASGSTLGVQAVPTNALLFATLHRAEPEPGDSRRRWMLRAVGEGCVGRSASDRKFHEYVTGQRERIKGLRRAPAASS
jgi:hypothetical protein